MDELFTWALYSSKLLDGSEVLTLRQNDRVFCEFAPAIANYKLWHAYFNGFPKFGLPSREACIRSAEKMAGQKLKVL